MDLDLSLHTWSQLAVNEVPDKHAAAATLETIAHDPDTVGCSHCWALTPGQIPGTGAAAKMLLVLAGHSTCGQFAPF